MQDTYIQCILQRDTTAGQTCDIIDDDVIAYINKVIPIELATLCLHILPVDTSQADTGAFTSVGR